MADPRHQAAIEQAVSGWKERYPAGESPAYLVGASEERAKLANGLRELAEFLESHPEVPISDVNKTFAVFVYGTPEEKRAQVDYASKLLGTPVTDHTPDGGHYFTARAFGSVTYEVMGTYPLAADAPVYPNGREVRLYGDAAKTAAAARMAQGGYVVGFEPGENGEHAYSVHFPGKVGTIHGLPHDTLAGARFRPVELANGSASSMEAAETLLVRRAAEIRADNLHGQAPSVAAVADHAVLARALSGICRLPEAELLRQIEPQVRHYMRTQMGVSRATGAKGATRAVASQPAAPDSVAKGKPPPGGRGPIRA